MTVIDENRIPVLKAISDTDGSVVDLSANDTNHSLKISDGLGGSDIGPVDDGRNENRKVAFMAVSAVDGITPVPVYADDGTGQLLVRSN